MNWKYWNIILKYINELKILKYDIKIYQFPHFMVSIELTQFLNSHKLRFTALVSVSNLC
jgi:hypothetical protein